MLLGHQNSLSFIRHGVRRLSQHVALHNYFRQTSLRRYVGDIPESERPSGLKVYSRYVTCLAESYVDLLVHTITHNGVLSLNSEALQFWSYGKNAVNVATLEDDGFPDFYEVQGISVTERRIMLIMDDESFVVLKRN